MKPAAEVPVPYHRGVVASLACVAALVLAACGGTDTAETTAETVDAPTTTVAPASSTTAAAPSSEPTTTAAETTTTTAATEPPPEEPTLCTAGQEMPDELYVSFAWEAGESRQLTREFSRSRPGRPMLNSETPVTLTAVDVTAEQTDLLWEYGDTKVDGIDDPAATAFLTQLTPPEIRYQLNDIGEFDQLTNLPELRTYIDDAMTTFEDELAFDPEIISQLRSTYSSMSDEQFSIAFAEEILAFHTFDGMTATVGANETFGGQLPSPFGGPPFDAVIELTVAPEFDAEGCATLSLVTIPDPETTPAIMRELVGNLVGEEITDEELFENFDFRNEITLQLDVATSQVRRIITDQVITSLGERGQDTKTITYLDEP